MGSWLIAHSTPAPGFGVEIYPNAGFALTRLPHLEVVISSTTIFPGSATATIAGTPLSLDPSGTPFQGTTSLVRSGQVSRVKGASYILRLASGSGFRDVFLNLLDVKRKIFLDQSGLDQLSFNLIGIFICTCTYVNEIR